MSKILALDYGSKKIGVAVSDPSGTIASTVGTIENKGKKQTITQVKELCQERSAAKIVVGVPYGLSGEETDQTRQTRRFIGELRSGIDIDVVEVDERFSSVIAKQQATDREEKVARADIDAGAARVILQDYLDSQK